MIFGKNFKSYSNNQLLSWWKLIWFISTNALYDQMSISKQYKWKNISYIDKQDVERSTQTTNNLF